MEFKVGDKVIKAKVYKPSSNDTYSYCCYGGNSTLVPLGTAGRVIEVVTREKIRVKFENGIEWYLDISELDFADSIPNINMTKKIINVLVVNKETGAVEKNATVVADNEQHAILKAFGVDAEKVYIKTTEQGSYEEEKKLTAVIEK